MTCEFSWELAPLTTEKIGAIADRYEQDLLEEARRENPRDFEVLVRLGELFSRRGCFEEGLSVDRILAELAPLDPIVHYNLACSLALTGSLESAFVALRKAIRLGYSDLPHLLEDSDLDALRSTPLFAQILRMLSP